MHNGRTAEFPKIKRRLRESLSDRYYNLIQGTTDSEHAFALFLNLLGGRIQNYAIADLADAMTETIQQLVTWQQEANINDPSYFNFALSDGYNIVASCYVTHPDHEPQSLYIAAGEQIVLKEGKCRVVPTSAHPGMAIVASEPLTAYRSYWRAVERNHLVTITPELHIEQRAIQ